jgi:hypothetical protein
MDSRRDDWWVVPSSPHQAAAAARKGLYYYQQKGSEASPELPASTLAPSHPFLLSPRQVQMEKDSSESTMADRVKFIG